MVSAVYTYPTNAELTEIEPVLRDQLTTSSPIFTHFPIESINSALLIWEQDENARGLQSARGINGEPAIVQSPGSNRFQMEPGYYGEETLIDEMKLTLRRQNATWATPVDISDLVRKDQDFLLGRETRRIEWVLWQMAINGMINVLGARGQTVYQGAVQVQRASAAVAWGTVATATPLVDFRDIQLLSRGTSNDFGAGATAYMNRVTANKLLANTNADDLGGRHVLGVQTVLNMPVANQILAGEGLANIVVYDAGYQDENNVTQQWIPDDTVVIFASRGGSKRIGSYTMTLNASNPGNEPGGYSYVTDSADQGRPTPRRIWVGKGHNGGPVFEFPSAVVVLDVS